MKEKIKEKIKDKFGYFLFQVVLAVIIIIIIFVSTSISSFVDNTDINLESLIRIRGNGSLFSDKDIDLKEEEYICELMYPQARGGFSLINDNVDYECVGSEDARYKDPDYDPNVEFSNQYLYCTKLKFEVKTYDYALAYKNAVKATNKYIEENENVSKKEIEKYFATRLEYEGSNIKKNQIRKSLFVYREKAHTSGSGHGGGITVTLLPDQKNNMDLANAILGGLVEEMERTKLPKGVDLEDTLQLMGIE